MKPVGCKSCADGYKGRVGVYEVVRVTPTIARIIMEEGNSMQIHEQARTEGFNDLRMSALEKAAQGLTSLEEVNRITQTRACSHSGPALTTKPGKTQAE